LSRSQCGVFLGARKVFKRALRAGNPGKGSWTIFDPFMLCVSSLRFNPIIVVEYLVIFIWLYLMVVLFYVMFTHSYLRNSMLRICCGHMVLIYFGFCTIVFCTCASLNSITLFILMAYIYEKAYGFSFLLFLLRLVLVRGIN